MSAETPLTDAAEKKSADEMKTEHYPSEAKAKHSNNGWKHARSLERRNSELTAELEDLRHFKKEVDGEGVVPATRVLDIERQVSELTARIAELERNVEFYKDDRDSMAKLVADLEKEHEKTVEALAVARKDGQRYIYRDYWNAEQSHRPYCNVIHDLKDENLFQLYHLEPLFAKAGISDGDEIEIIVRKTGNRPFGNRIWKLIQPHGYGPVDEAATPLPETEGTI